MIVIPNPPITAEVESDRAAMAEVQVLTDEGWTFDAAMNHVYGTCDRYLCGHASHWCPECSSSLTQGPCHGYPRGA